MNEKHNADHEKAVLAAMKADNAIYDDAGLSDEDFHSQAHRILFSTIAKIIESGRKADDLELYEELNKSGQLEAVGGMTEVAALDDTPTGNLDFYIDSVKNFAAKRKLDLLLRRAIEELNKETAESVLETVEAGITDIMKVDAAELKWLKEILPEAIEKIEEIHKHPGEILGVESGFRSLDKVTNGFQKGDMIVIGARPSIGKTAFAMSMAINMARKGTVVGFFSCEMNALQMAFRMIAAEGRINLGSIRSGYLDDYGDLIDACGRLHRLQIMLDETPNIFLSKLKSKARKMKRLGAEILIVDYLTLIQHGDPRMPMFERVGDISKQLKQLARELDVPMIVLSQVGREAEDQIPSLANLRMSGAIEEDSDVIIFLHRNRDEEQTKLKVAKNRNGPVGILELIFKLGFVRFEEKSYQEELL